MSETFEATLELKEGRYPAARMVMVNPETGERHFIFPTELFKLVEGIGFSGTWETINRGGVLGVRLVNKKEAN
ncbi:Uncharacterised protein [Nocardia farcinica]|uniref:hypothetical protein n=1 Tax=Nocardia farcinica TaxID=37329 RepID=UPI000DFE18F7|nr:hypothetical protein [Nocardia farcinica]SUE29570.1 Uncharacterised protein [Nocardia farcinica]